MEFIYISISYLVYFINILQIYLIIYYFLKNDCEFYCKIFIDNFFNLNYIKY